MRSYGRVGWVGSGLVARLRRRLSNASAIDAELLERVLAAPVGIDDVVPWVRFEADRYVRVSVCHEQAFEIRLLCWAPGQSSALHAHGEARCGFRVLTGTATETRLGIPDRLLTPGTVATLHGEGIHQVANRGSAALVTLHVYAPPLPVDAPSGPDGHRIVVLGGGSCSSALAVHLLCTGRPDLRITIVEPVAMPGDHAALETAIRTRPGRLRIVRRPVVAIRAAGDAKRVLLDDGTELVADDLVHADARLGEPKLSETTLEGER